ncbi:MAG: glutamate mutase L [Candidatus Tectomicrobia bacterium]|nr:glutamate mutase L [Candidatus Tectomicrobia bacterium]
MNAINRLLITDCGSTTTKAILIEKKGEEYRQTFRGEAPTTVESPFDDVTIGVINAASEVEELSGQTLIRNGQIITPSRGGEGVDLYLSTSSAGGGLQMVVTGIVKTMTAESAARAALGAGAIVMDTLSIDDGRRPHERAQRIRHLRPDIILLSGGVDGGTKSHVVELAEVILSADPKPRFGKTLRLPIIYAGNRDVREEIKALLDRYTEVTIVENLRPRLEQENLQPAREAIHDLFLQHVMAHAPGYDKLISWVDGEIMPTPAAMGKIIQTLAEEDQINVLAVDIGGATTDTFSVFGGVFNRTVSANLGMSYSIGNVLIEAGLEKIMRWIPFEVNEQDIRNRLRNKMIRPTTIPQTREDLLIEQAVAREALRLAFLHHKQLAVGLKGVQQQRTISEAFAQKMTGETLVNMMALDLIIGSGGVLSHAPSRGQAALMMIDAYEPEGITTLAVDSIFMMPHLGVFSSVHPQGAAQVLRKDCLIYLGTVIAPPGQGRREGEEVCRVQIHGQEETLSFGKIKVIPLTEEADVTVRPARRFDVGQGYGQEVIEKVKGGVVGLILDGRGRPLVIPEDHKDRIKKMGGWVKAFE